MPTCEDESVFNASIGDVFHESLIHVLLTSQKSSLLPRHHGIVTFSQRVNVPVGPLQAQGWHSPLHLAWSVFASARPPLSSSWTQAICALPRSAHRCSTPAPRPIVFLECQPGVDEAKNSAGINYAVYEIFAPSNPLQMPAKLISQRQSLFLSHSLLHAHQSRTPARQQK